MVWKKKTADTAVPEENAEAAAGEDRDKEITEADKQELLEKFDKESKTRTFVSPAVAWHIRYSQFWLRCIILCLHPVSGCLRH